MSRRGGFSLLEALIAMTIASVLVILVSSIFLAQNRFYTGSVFRTRADDAIRTATEFMTGELRTAPVGGFVVAEPRRMVTRVPLTLGAICDQRGVNARVYLPGLSGLDPAAVSGYAVRDSLDAWAYTAGDWSDIARSRGSAAARVCRSEAIDTVGIVDEFVVMRLDASDEGDLVMIYRELEYRIAPSMLDAGTLALFQGEAGGTLIELASGFQRDSRFEYRVGSTFSTSVTSRLDSIEEVRLTFVAGGQGDSTGTRGYSSTLAVRVPLAGGR